MLGSLVLGRVRPFLRDKRASLLTGLLAGLLHRKLLRDRAGSPPGLARLRSCLSALCRPSIPLMLSRKADLRSFTHSPPPPISTRPVSPPRSPLPHHRSSLHDTLTKSVDSSSSRPTSKSTPTPPTPFKSPFSTSLCTSRRASPTLSRGRLQGKVCGGD